MFGGDARIGTSRAAPSSPKIVTCRGSLVGRMPFSMVITGNLLGDHQEQIQWLGRASRLSANERDIADGEAAGAVYQIGKTFPLGAVLARFAQRG